MFGHRARFGFAAIALGGVVLAASTLAGAGDAQAFGGRYERAYERPVYDYGWR